MAVSTEAVGKRCEPVVYAVGREKIREYAAAVGETDPVHLDLEAARAAGYADLVAPPMFAAVYFAPAIGPAILDPALGADFAMLVHGAQEFAWDALVVAGDEITTTARVEEISERSGLSFYVLGSESENQRGGTIETSAEQGGRKIVRIAVAEIGLEG